jgi:hypothetical protein
VDSRGFFYLGYLNRRREMDFGLFAAGTAGAFLVVYLAKHHPIPEFRPFFDVSDTFESARKLRVRIDATQKDIDDAQNQVWDPNTNPDLAKRLEYIIDSSAKELEGARDALEPLEKTLKIHQIISRTMGFASYVVIGGLAGAWLPGYVTVNGFTGDLPDYFEALFIGGTWTTYLSALGLSHLKKGVDKQLDYAKEDIAEGVIAEEARLGDKPATAFITQMVSSRLGEVKRWANKRL